MSCEPCIPAAQPVHENVDVALHRLGKLACLAVMLATSGLAGYWGLALWGRQEDDEARSSLNRRYMAHRNQLAALDLARTKEVVDKFLAHLRKEELAAAYAMTSEAFREEYTADQFQELLTGGAAILKRPARFVALNFQAMNQEPGQRLEYAAQIDNDRFGTFAVVIVNDDEGMRVAKWQVRR